jgi:hypothetical protein
MNNKNITHVINALNRINHELAKGPNYHGAHQLKLLRKAHARLTKQLNEFTKPSARPRPLPPVHYQKSLFTNR